MSQTTRGEYLISLSVVDIATGWWEGLATPYRSQVHVFAALKVIRQRLPFPLLGIDSDNDSAFINAHLLRYCQQEQITFPTGILYGHPLSPLQEKRPSPH